MKYHSNQQIFIVKYNLLSTLILIILSYKNIYIRLWTGVKWKWTQKHRNEQRDENMRLDLGRMNWLKKKGVTVLPLKRRLYHVGKLGGRLWRSISKVA